MIAVGTGIIGLLIGLSVGSFYDYGGEAGWQKGMEGRHNEKSDKMSGRNQSSNGRENNDNKGGMMMHDNMLGNDGMMGAGMGMAVGSEREFIEHMIPHHEEAVATAKEVLARGGSTAEIKTLAQNIVTAQEKEISDMKVWYKNWYGSDYVENSSYQSMMRPLTGLSGAELDKVFLTDMVKHHMMAIMMAKSVAAHIEHDEIKTLAATIQVNQLTEITTMQNLLANLK